MELKSQYSCRKKKKAQRLPLISSVLQDLLHSTTTLEIHYGKRLWIINLYFKKKSDLGYSILYTTCASVLFIAMNHTFNTMWIKQGEILLSYEVFFYNLKCCSLMPVSHPSIHSALSHLLSPTLTTGLYLPPNNLHVLLLLKLFTIPIFLNNFLFPDPPKESHKQVPKCRLILF